MNSDASLQDRIAGCILGAVIGDAMGHPTEFLSVSEIQSRWGPRGIERYELWWERDGSRFAPYTDDTQMVEIVLAALLKSGSYDFKEPHHVDALMEEIARGFVTWAQAPQGGHRAPGNACLAGARALAQGEHWSRAGGASAGGCGSVMRAYPFGIRCMEDIELAESLAVSHSKLTHRDPIALAACAAMSVATAHVLRQTPLSQTVVAMCEAAGRHCEKTAAMLQAAADDAHNGRPPELVLDRLRGWAAHEALAAGLFVFLRHSHDPRAAILEAANTPGDSDSIATLAGALVGARCGLSALPPDWVADVERGDVFLANAVQFTTPASFHGNLG